jgi:hypothetical protein
MEAMATNNAQNGPVGAGAQRRDPSSVSLDYYEWAFHEVAADERPACHWRELCREALSGKQRLSLWPPWLGRTKAEKERDSFDSQRPPSALWSIQDAWTIPDGSFVGRVPWAFDQIFKPVQPQEWEVLKLQIDWLASDDKLKQDFGRWLATKRNSEGSLACKFKGAKGKRGPRGLVDDQLVDLAIYRAKKAGYKTTKALSKKLSPLLEKLGSVKKLDAQRVYDACQRVTKRIKGTGF